MNGKFRAKRVLAGLLCLLLLVGFLPAEQFGSWLGNLIPEADAAAINFKTWTKDNFNGLFIIRSDSDPSLVLTQTGYFNTQLTFQKLGSAGDIRKQMFLFRSSRNSLTTNIKNNTTVYFRSLYDVYRYTIDNGGSYGNMWIQSGRADYPSPYPIVVSSDYNAGVPEDATSGQFGWKLNIYADAIGDGEYAGFMQAGIYENNSGGDNDTTPRYICRQGSNAVFMYGASASNYAYIFQPVSYGIPDARNVNLHTSISETSQYLQADYSFVANSSVVNYNSSNADWPTAWSLSRLPNGYHAIVSTQHGRYLAISDAGNPTLGNKAVLTDNAWSYPQDAEQWQFVPYYYHGQGFTYLIVNKASGRLLLRSASGNTHICDSYYTANQQCNRWMITYISNSKYQNTVSNAGYTLQTGYSPMAYSNSTTGIKYPLNLTTGSSAAYSTYNTLKLNPASTVTGHFFDADKAVNNATAEARFKSTSGYVFDTRFLTDSAYNMWEQAISYSDGVIQNTLNAYQSNLLSTGNPPHPFKPVGSSNYTATIQFQFKYTSGMFMKYYGGKYSFNVKIRSTDLNTVYFDNWTADTDMNVDFSKLTAGTTYVMTISKASNSDANSHFSIFTNIQPIVMQNELDGNGKTKLFDVGANVYQGGQKLALNGAAVIGTPLEYGFTVTNNSQTYNLLVQEFSSPVLNDSAEDISHWGIRNLNGFSVTSAGVVKAGSAVDKTGGTLELADLVFNVYNTNGTLIKSLTSPTVSTLGTFLTNVPNDAAGNSSYGLPYGWTIEVRGIYYNPTEADLETYARKMVVPYITVKFHTPGTNSTFSKYGDNTSTHFTNEPFFVQWAGQNITVSKELLFELIQKAGKHKYEISKQGLSAGTITSLSIVDNNGAPKPTNNLAVQNNTTLVLKHSQADRYQYNIKVYFNGTFAFVPIQVFVYDVSDDNVFVLDYGLPVEIPKDKYTTNKDFNQPYNKLEIGTPFATTITIMQITGTKPTHNGTSLIVTDDLTTTYGSIKLADNGTITYTPTAFLNGPDYIYVVFKLERVGKLGVEVADVLLMYKTITILPGNVVYYEDTIGSVTYPDGFKLEQLGSISGVSGTQKLPTGSGNYGYDDGSYADSKDVTLSGLSYHKVPVHDKQVELNFTFKGTGFELISRVNAFDSATIIVKVRPHGGTDADWTWYPVITQFDPNGNGLTEVYQVPVFRLNNGVYGTYDVQVVGLPKAASNEYDENGNPIGGYTTNYIYIDGIRVYNPLGYDNSLTENYGNEQGAKFDNIRDLILDGKGMVATITEDNKTSQFTTGSYYYVPDEDGTLTAALGGINELGAIGANNEILIRKNAGDNMIVLRVKDNGGGLLQVGIHDIHDTMFDGADPKSAKNDPTTVHIRTTSGWTALASGIYHGTEQYYNIDLAQCPTDGTYKIVMLKVESGFASFTNVKHKNVDFGTIGEKALDIYVQPGFYINQSGDMCKIDENGNEEIVQPGVMTNLSLLNSLLQDETM